MTNSFDMGSLGLGSLNSMLESVDLVKKAWSSFNLPASLAPTMDVEELDKRIADLKTVEQWLNVNLSMLRGTIQGMEVQRGTLAALKSFGDTLAPNAQGLAAMAAAAAQAAIRATQPGSPDAAGPSPSDTADAGNRPAQAPGPQATGEAPAPQADDSIAAGLSRAAATAINPSAWWTLLQEQFNQVAQAAIAGTQAAAAAPDKAGPDNQTPARRAAGKAPGRKASSARPTAAPAEAQPRKRAATKPPGAAQPAPRRSRTKAN